MGLLKLTTRKRNVPGSLSSNLLSIERSIGYLQGGYKDSVIFSKVQLFNTNTQIGRIVYDTGYLRSYRPGISGANNGYFSINDAVQYNKFNYITATAAVVPFTTTLHPGTTSCDFGTYSEAWLLCATVAGWDAVTHISSWNKINLSTDAITNYGNLSTGPLSTTRQGIGTGIAAIFTAPDTIQLTSLRFTDRAVSVIGGIASLNASQQVPCGMSVNNTKAYMVGMSGINVRLTLSGSTITAQALATSYTYNFGESHAVSSSSSGYMMAGYSDTTGRYGSTQHGLCQKITFATEAITTLPDLVMPQSSGQMMQGF